MIKLKEIGITIILLTSSLIALSGCTNKSSYHIGEDFSTFTSKKGEGWDLFIETKNGTDKIRGFMSKEDCLKAGLKQTNNGDYECGYKCKTTTSIIDERVDKADICEKICTEKGCRD